MGVNPNNCRIQYEFDALKNHLFHETRVAMQSVLGSTKINSIIRVADPDPHGSALSADLALKSKCRSSTRIRIRSRIVVKKVGYGFAFK